MRTQEINFLLSNKGLPSKKNTSPRAFQQVLLGGFEILKNHQKAPVGRSWSIFVWGQMIQSNCFEASSLKDKANSYPEKKLELTDPQTSLEPPLPNLS